MFCSYCRRERGENHAPCPHCGASSPLSGNGQHGPGERRSFLPVPYQSGVMQQMGSAGHQAQDAAHQMIPLQDTAKLASMLPVQPEEYDVISIPPMYTKPRAIIPRYRIISGFLSVLIVFVLVCAGLGYYAKASGRINDLRKMTGTLLPPNLHPTPTPALADPPDRVDQGPAYLIIPSAIITSHLDPKDPFFALKSDTVFTPGQTFYVIYSVQHPKTKGIVVIKWYTNGILYTSASSRTIDTGANVTGKAAMQYAKPAEGSVELYWNNDLAQRLYFVVRN